MQNIFPNIPVSLPPKSELPNGTSRMIWKWSYPRERLGEKVVIKGVQYKKMLTLDLNIPESGFAQKVNSAPLTSARETFRSSYDCIHRCPGCFNEAELHNPIMTMEEVWAVVDQAVELGLESVKFLGPGELTINPQLFDILDRFASRNLVLGIFTKAAALGNDAVACHFHGISSEELVRRLVAYPNITFLVGARSFDPYQENLFIPSNNARFASKFDYHASRGLALERLIEAGMNKDLANPRLALIASPVTHQNIGCVGEMYKWGAERNIPVYLPPTMVSGKGHKLLKAVNEKFAQSYTDLAVELYVWAIERGVITLQQFRDEGPHPYIGVAPCNQLTHGMYIHYDGTVQRCPGNDTPDFIVHPDVRKAPLYEIWRGSKNYGLNQFNNGCVKDGVSLPTRFYGEVRARVLAAVKV